MRKLHQISIITRLVIFLFAINLDGKEPSIDSLKKEISSNKHDSLKVKDFQMLWRTYMSIDIDTAYLYAIKGLELSKNIKNPTGIADFAVYAAFVKSQKGEKDEALFLMTKELKLIEAEYDFLQGELFLIQWIAETYREHNQSDSALFYFQKMYDNTQGTHPEFEIGANVGIGHVYQQSRLFRPALKYYQVADSICQKENTNTNTCTTCITNIGAILLEILDYENAERYFARAERQYSSRNENYLLNELKFLQAQGFYLKKNLSKALSVTKEAIAFFEKQESLLKLYEGYELLVLIYNKQDDVVKAKESIDRQYLVAHQLEDSSKITASYIDLANVLNLQGKPLEALAMVNDVQKFISQSEDHFLKQSYFKTLTGIHTYLKNWREAYIASLKMYKETQAINIQNSVSAIKEAEITHDIKNKEQRIALLNTEHQLTLQQKANQRIIMILGFAFLFILSFVLFYLNRLKQKTNSKLVEVDKIKSRFFTNISHELRTPLTLIQNPLDLILKSQSLSGLERTRLQTIKRNKDKLKSLVENLLDLSKLQAGTFQLTISKNSGAKHLKAIFSNFESLKFNKDQDYYFEVNISTDHLYYDPEIIETICYNLLSNAFKYSPIGSRINAEAMIKDNKLVIVISDNGKGISKDEQKRIFERYYRSSKGDENIEGLGIGLALVDEVVQVHYGSIELVSNEETGTKFIIGIPCDKNFYVAKNYIIQTREILNSTFTNVSDTSLVVPLDSSNTEDDFPIMLIVEDNKDMRSHLKDLFRGDYHILEAANGAEGFDITLREVPDVIVTDLMMPQMDGAEMCRQIKQDLRVSHVPIIMLTAKAGERDKIETLKIGVDDYISKPFNNDELCLKVTNLLNRIRTIREKYENQSYVDNKELSLTESDKLFWAQLDEVVKLNMDNPDFTMEDFGRQMHMSRMQLHRKLRALTNLSASAFLRDQRLKTAEELIKSNTDLNVSELAYRVGFTSRSYFSKCFKEVYGYAPSEYKEGRVVKIRG